jgi:anti-sigma factor RsiW
MRCKDIQNGIVEAAGKQTAPVAEHLASCPACRAFVRDWRLTSLGFQALAQEAVPEATLGFAERVVRLLQDPSSEKRFGEQFLVGVGRRFVYAGLLVTLLMLMGLLLPASGPLRGPAAAELYIAQSETSTGWNDPLFSDDVQANRATGLIRLNHEGNEQGAK